MVSVCWEGRGNGILTTSRLLISTILAISFAVTQFCLGNAFGLSASSALGAEELVIQTGYRRAIRLVAVVRAVPEAVAMELTGNAHLVRAPILARVAWREI